MSTPALPTFTSSEKSTLFTLCRHALYIGLQLAIVFLLWQLGHHYHEELIEEYGLLENIQLGVLVFTCALLLAEAARCERYRAVLFSLAMLLAAASVRELDAFFDDHLPVISWKFCWIFPLLGATVLYRQVKRDRAPLFEFLNSSSFSIMLMAFITIVPLAQCIGHRHFVMDVLGTEEDPRIIRRFLEEPFELMGYFQILLATLEFRFGLIRKQLKG